MAKKSRALVPSAPRVVVMQAPRRAGGRVRRVASRARSIAKRGGQAFAKGAWEEKTAIAAVGGAGVVGFLEGAGHLDMIPDLGIGKVPVLAVGAYFAGRAFKSVKLRHAGIGLAAAAAFAFGQDAGKRRK